MKIGLIRHFRVDLKKNIFMTSEQYNKYTNEYDISGVIKNEVVVDREWDKCYCSSLSRAITTAKTVYHGPILITDKLVEIPSKAFVSTIVPLPYHVWAIFGRVAWIRNHMSQPEARKITLKRIESILEVILEEKDKNILIVSHAGTLYEIQKILRKKGFKGDRFLKPRNGRLYKLEKEDL